MSIYNDPDQYAKLTRIPLETAKIFCNHYLNVQEEIEKATICPKCGEQTLDYESGSYEEGTNTYVFCANDSIKRIDNEGNEYEDECEFSSEDVEKFAPLFPHYDLDVVLYFASTFKEEENWDKSTKEVIGSPWHEFVENRLKDIQEEERMKKVTPENIDELIEDWHNSSDKEKRELHEFLGLTWEQYVEYVETNQLPKS